MLRDIDLDVIEAEVVAGLDLLSTGGVELDGVSQDDELRRFKLASRPKSGNRNHVN